MLRAVAGIQGFTYRVPLRFPVTSFDQVRRRRNFQPSTKLTKILFRQTHGSPISYDRGQRASLCRHTTYCSANANSAGECSNRDIANSVLMLLALGWCLKMGLTPLNVGSTSSTAADAAAVIRRLLLHTSSSSSSSALGGTMWQAVLRWTGVILLASLAAMSAPTDALTRVTVAALHFWRLKLGGVCVMAARLLLPKDGRRTSEGGVANEGREERQKRVDDEMSTLHLDDFPATRVRGVENRHVLEDELRRLHKELNQLRDVSSSHRDEVPSDHFKVEADRVSMQTRNGASGKLDQALGPEASLREETSSGSASWKPKDLSLDRDESLEGSCDGSYVQSHDDSRVASHGRPHDRSHDGSYGGSHDGSNDISYGGFHHGLCDGPHDRSHDGPSQSDNHHSHSCDTQESGGDRKWDPNEELAALKAELHSLRFQRGVVDEWTAKERRTRGELDSMQDMEDQGNPTESFGADGVSRGGKQIPINSQDSNEMRMSNSHWSEIPRLQSESTQRNNSDSVSIQSDKKSGYEVVGSQLVSRNEYEVAVSQLQSRNGSPSIDLHSGMRNEFEKETREHAATAEALVKEVKLLETQLRKCDLARAELEERVRLQGVELQAVRDELAKNSRKSEGGQIGYVKCETSSSFSNNSSVWHNNDVHRGVDSVRRSDSHAILAGCMPSPYTQDTWENEDITLDKYLRKGRTLRETLARSVAGKNYPGTDPKVNPTLSSSTSITGRDLAGVDPCLHISAEETSAVMNSTSDSVEKASLAVMLQDEASREWDSNIKDEDIMLDKYIRKGRTLRETLARSVVDKNFLGILGTDSKMNPNPSSSISTTERDLPGIAPCKNISAAKRSAVMNSTSDSVDKTSLAELLQDEASHEWKSDIEYNNSVINMPKLDEYELPRQQEFSAMLHEESMNDSESEFDSKFDSESEEYGWQHNFVKSQTPEIKQSDGGGEVTEETEESEFWMNQLRTLRIRRLTEELNNLRTGSGKPQEQ